MTISFDLPQEIIERLAAGGLEPGAVAKESVLVELYRHGKISHGELAHSLGLSRYETDGVLNRHNVTEDLITSQELARQVERLRKLVG